MQAVLCNGCGTVLMAPLEKIESHLELTEVRTDGLWDTKHYCMACAPKSIDLNSFYTELRIRKVS